MIFPLSLGQTCNNDSNDIKWHLRLGIKGNTVPTWFPWLAQLYRLSCYAARKSISHVRGDSTCFTNNFSCIHQYQLPGRLWESLPVLELSKVLPWEAGTSCVPELCFQYFRLHIKIKDYGWLCCYILEEFATVKGIRCYIMSVINLIWVLYPY